MIVNNEVYISYIGHVGISKQKGKDNKLLVQNNTKIEWPGQSKLFEGVK